MTMSSCRSLTCKSFPFLPLSFFGGNLSNLLPLCSIFPVSSATFPPFHFFFFFIGESFPPFLSVRFVIPFWVCFPQQEFRYFDTQLLESHRKHYSTQLWKGEGSLLPKCKWYQCADKSVMYTYTIILCIILCISIVHKVFYDTNICRLSPRCSIYDMLCCVYFFPIGSFKDAFWE